MAELYHEKGLTQKKIAERLDVTQGCISKRMKEHGINSGYDFWSEDEEKILQKNYKQVSKQEAIELLPGRSWEAIKLKAMELGLSTPIEKHRKSKEVIRQLRKNSEENTLEVDFGRGAALSYVLGVIDGDGFHDRNGAVGLETKSKEFADKFADSLKSIGLNPGRGNRRGKETVWASSKQLVKWLMQLDYESKFEWLENSGSRWEYIEGAYDSDGNFSNPGPRICSYDEEEKQFLKRVLESLGLEANIHSNNVYVPAKSKKKFFENVDTVYDERKPLTML